MAMQMETGGWQPQFELSALRSGEKYALAKGQEEEELLKSQLANFLSQQTMGNDILKSNLAGQQAGAMNTPERIQAYVDSNMGKYASDTAKGQLDSQTVNSNILAKNAENAQTVDNRELAALLQPFKRQQVPYEGQAGIDKARGMSAMMGNQTGIVTGRDAQGNAYAPAVLDNMRKDYQSQVATLGNTPEHWGKVDVENVKGEWDLKKARIAAAASEASARHGGKAAWAYAIGPATQLITGSQSTLAKLNSNAMDEEIGRLLRTRGLVPGTPKYNEALKSEKDTQRTELERQIKEGQQFLTEIRTAAGMGGLQTQTGGGSTNKNSTSNSAPLGSKENPHKL
jgi:hypothetical protein